MSKDEEEEFFKNASKNSEKPGLNSLEILDDIAKLVEVYTGIKNTFMNSGWSEEVSERLTLEFARASNMSEEQRKQKELLLIEKGFNFESLG